MGNMKKYNPVKNEYEEYSIPANWNTPLLTDDMDEIVNCARCGGLISFGMCCTSRQIHNDFGLGYPVCPRCYEEEMREENE